jgi:hypothetical protein
LKRKEDGTGNRTVFFYVHQSVFLNRSTYGAGLSAASALNALIGVDNELCVLLGNAVYGALGLASTALNALIGNFISHDLHLQCIELYPFYHTLQKNQEENEYFFEIMQKKSFSIA